MHDKIYCIRKSAKFVFRLSYFYTHLEMERYGISNTRKNQIFIDFSSVVN